MKAVLIIAHNCILPGAYKGFEAILDRLHHEMPGTRVASTSLVDLENDLYSLLREGPESVILLPYLLLNGRHSKNDVPKVVAKLQAKFPQIPMTLLPPLGEWDGFIDMVAGQVCKVNCERASRETATDCRSDSHAEGHFDSHAGINVSVIEPHSAKPSLFAIELNLEGRNVLVVGGGRIALRKVKTLLPTGARITVVAPVMDPELKEIASSHSSFTLKERPYEPLDLRGIYLTFICSDQPQVNAQVSNDARARRILVNNACDYLDGDFIVPARMDFGENICVTVSTQGKSPALAKKLKQKIQTEWGSDLEQMEKAAGTLRS